MAIGRSFLSKVAIVKGSTWGAAVDANVAGKALNFLEEGLAVDSNLLPDETITGTADRKTGITGAKTVAGPITTNLQYSNQVIETLIAMCMGRADNRVTPLGTDGSKPYAYYGSYRLGNTLESYFVSMSFDKQVGSLIHEYDSIKVNGMTITGSAGSITEISFDLIGRELKTTGTTTTSLSTATITVPRKYIRFEDFQFRINQTSDSALAATDQFYPSSFTITIANNTEGDHTSENSPFIDEPIRNDTRSVTGSFEIPKYTDTTIEQRFFDGTEMKMDIRARSTTQIPAAGGGPYYYAFELFFPTIQITEANRPINRASKIPANFSWVASEVTSTAPSGMDGSGDLSTLTNTQSKGSITESFRIETTNVEAANPLA